MLSTPALERVSGGIAAAFCERIDCEAPVTPETLLALLFRPEMLETLSVKGIVPPLKQVSEGSDDSKTVAIRQIEDEDVEQKQENEQRRGW